MFIDPAFPPGRDSAINNVRRSESASQFLFKRHFVDQSAGFVNLDQKVCLLQLWDFIGVEKNRLISFDVREHQYLSGDQLVESVVSAFPKNENTV